jgi:hypothetical protein
MSVFTCYRGFPVDLGGLGWLGSCCVVLTEYDICGEGERALPFALGHIKWHSR